MESQDYAQNKASREEAQKIVHRLNSMTSGEDERAMISVFTGEHRTLQQKLGGLFINTFLVWAENYEKENYDMRNEELCKIAKMIKDKLEAEDKIFRGKVALPFI